MSVSFEWPVGDLFNPDPPDWPQEAIEAVATLRERFNTVLSHVILAADTIEASTACSVAVASGADYRRCGNAAVPVEVANGSGYGGPSTLMLCTMHRKSVSDALGTNRVRNERDRALSELTVARQRILLLERDLKELMAELYGDEDDEPINTGASE